MVWHGRCERSEHKGSDTLCHGAMGVSGLANRGQWDASPEAEGERAGRSWFHKGQPLFFKEAPYCLFGVFDV